MNPVHAPSSHPATWRSPRSGIHCAVLGLCVLAAGCAPDRTPAGPAAAPAGDADHVWVEIQGRNDEGKYFYNYGRIRRSTLERVIESGTYPEVIYIEDFHWYSGHVTLLEDGVKTGAVLLDIADVTRISVIKDQDLETLRRKEREGMEKAKQEREAAAAGSGAGEDDDAIP